MTGHLVPLLTCDGCQYRQVPAVADVEVIWCVERGVPVHHLPLAWGSTTALARLRSWLDEVEEVIHAR